MLAKQQEQLEQGIRMLLRDGRLKGKKLYVFGSNEPAERIIDALLEAGYKTERMLDNNERKKGFSYKGTGVSLPAGELLPFQENALVLIASKYYSEMLLQLQGMGYQEGIHVVKVVHMETGSHFSLTEETFDQEYQLIKKGTDVLKKLHQQYGEDVTVFIFPWQAIGDIYMAARYLRAFIRKKEDVSGEELNYVITIMGGIRKKVAGLCGYSRIHVLEEKESYALCRAVTFLGNKETKALILQHRFIYTNRIWHLGNYKGITFDDHFRYSIFNLSKDCEVVTPAQREDEEALKKLFFENGLKPGKTVIIAPYANTIANPSPKFWESLVEALQKRGYCVCTNSSGDKSEPALKGTKAVLFPFDLMLKAVEYAGIFIGLRSGLCDFTASAAGQKIILYPDRIYAQGPVIDFYSLKRMGLTEEADEFVYQDNAPEETLKEVLMCMK